MTARPDRTRPGDQRISLIAGVALSLVAAGVAGAATGLRGAAAAFGFGLVATVIQLGAGRLMHGMERRTLPEFMKRWGSGMGLRMLGVLLVGLVALLDLPAIPPIPAALAYVGVLIPLLFLEARRI